MSLAHGARADASGASGERVLGDANQAEALFRAGKESLAREDYAAACPKFAESFRIDAATGTLLALAICHERAGRLASAYYEYTEVLARSKGESRPDRERAARQRSTALAARVSTLTVSMSQVGQVAGLEVRVDGSTVDARQFGKPTPIDGGAHVVEVWAPGSKTWRTTLTLAASIDARTVVVPPLEPEVPQARDAAREAARAARHARSRSPSHVDESYGPTATQWLGIAATGVGIVGLGVGAYFAVLAMSKNRSSSAGCEGDVCTAEARGDRLDARQAGDRATISLAAGGAIAVTGLVLILAGGEPERDSRHALRAAPLIGARTAGATLQGSF